MQTPTSVLAEFPPVDELPPRPELPPALVMLDGTPVTTAEQWRTQRRPELKALFEHYMYGVTPGPVPIEATVTKEATGLCDGAVRLQEIEIRFPELAADAPRIHLALFLPADAEGPVPVFLASHRRGPHAVVFDEEVTIREYPSDKEQVDRGTDAEAWSVPYLASRGWGLALFYVADIDPDKPDPTDGIHPHFQLPGDPDTHWGTIAAWAWGLQRAVDYLVTNPAVDAEKICLTGHSRRGKTALLAAALDERIALVVPHQSGTGGMALSRDNDQETVERINRVFPHWFNGNFKKFNDREELLPLDQHLLVAMVAPRPLLDNGGLQDKWANYERAHVSLQHASPVYELLGVPGLVGTGIVSEDEPIVGENFGTLLQYRQDVKHVLNQTYWRAMLDFADAHLRGTAEK